MWRLSKHRLSVSKFRRSVPFAPRRQIERLLWHCGQTVFCSGCDGIGEPHPSVEPPERKRLATGLQVVVRLPGSSFKTIGQSADIKPVNLKATCLVVVCVERGRDAVKPVIDTICCWGNMNNPPAGPQHTAAVTQRCADVKYVLDRTAVENDVECLKKMRWRLRLVQIEKLIRGFVLGAVNSNALLKSQQLVERIIRNEFPFPKG